MANEDKQEIKIPERKIPSVEQVSPAEKPERFFEAKEMSKEDRIVSSELRKEIEMMQLEPSAQKEAEKKAEKISFLAEEEKVKHLLEIARKKGLVFAIQVARKTNEPYLLDILHDTLAQEGYYKDFTK